MEVKKILDEVRKDIGNKRKLKEKVITIGLSAGGSLASRFSALYPDDVSFVLSFLNEQLLIPLKEYKGLKLPFPFGLDGVEECPDIAIELEQIEQYLKIPKFIYIDRTDESDSLPLDINKEFFTKYMEIFGLELYKRAYNLSTFLYEEFKDMIELVIPTGN